MDGQKQKASLYHLLKWGYLRLFLGILQTSLVAAALWLLLTIGLRPATWLLIASATAVSLFSRFLYRGHGEPELNTKSSRNSESSFLLYPGLPSADETKHNDKRVLIADHVTATVEAVTYNLEKAGFTVVTAHNVRSCIDVFRASNPDIVILNVTLASGSGLEACKAIRLESRAPIILLGTLPEPEDCCVGCAFR